LIFSVYDDEIRGLAKRRRRIVIIISAVILGLYFMMSPWCILGIYDQ